MNVGLVIGKHHSKGLPGKNFMEVLGRPMVEYAFLAVKQTSRIDDVFVSTDSPEIKEVGEKYGAEIINRPPELATSEAPSDAVLVHAMEHIEDNYEEEIDIMSVSYANAPHIKPELIDKGIEIVKKNAGIDTAFSVSEYNMFVPYRARKVTEDGFIEPFDYSLFKDGTVPHNRQEGDDCYFIDWAVQIISRETLVDIKNDEINLENSNPPFYQLGERSYALENEYGFDVDEEWQIPVIKRWLQDHGFSKGETPYDDEEMNY